jgi:hypothetical protein
MLEAYPARKRLTLGSSRFAIHHGLASKIPSPNCLSRQQSHSPAPKRPVRWPWSLLMGWPSTPGFSGVLRNRADRIGRLSLANRSVRAGHVEILRG